MSVSRPRTMLVLGLLGSLLLHWLHLGPYYYDIAIGIGINIILAVSLNLVNGYAGQFSLGHAGFMAAGAYSSAALTNAVNSALGSLGLAGSELLFVSALLVGGITAGLAGLLVGVPSLRLRGDYLAIVTLGFGEIIRVGLQNAEAVGGARGLSVTGGYTNLSWTFAVVVVTIYVVTALVHSTYGCGFLCVRDDEVAAESIGIQTTKFKVVAFVAGAFFAGVAGGLYAHFKQYINPSGFDFLRSVDVLVMVILGGMGSTAGVVLAAVILTILPELLRAAAGWEALPGFLRELASNRMIIYSVLLIALMLLRPQGLFGDTEAVRRSGAKPGKTK